MKTLLRSTFIVGTESPEAMAANFRLLESSSLGFEDPNDTTLWNFIKDFTFQHHHPPHLTTIRAHFERSNLLTVVDRLEAVALSKPKMMGDFEHHLNGKVEDRRKRLVGTYLQEASEILMKGIEVKSTGGDKEMLIGPHAAMRFLLDKAHDILTPITGVRLSGEVTSDADDFLAEYARVKSDPLAGIGQFTGITQIDRALGGAKRHELWTHAAFTGHLKSSLMLNWAYNQAVFYRHDTLIFSLEMPYHQCRRLIYALHSAHEKFRCDHPPLDYMRTRDGLLTDEEEAFLEKVAFDFRDGEYGRIHIEIADPNKSDFTVADIRHRAETIYAASPFQLLFVDHALLVSPRKWVSNTTDRLNEVIRDCKKMAMSFNKGMGIPVVLLFQISREGYKAARKARGLDAHDRDGAPKEVRSNYIYNLTHLSYANECILHDTPIITQRGTVPVVDVQVGDRVYSSSGWKSVLATFDQGVRPLWTVTTGKGSQITTTGGHRVRVLQDERVEWCEVRHLTPESLVLGLLGGAFPASGPALPTLTDRRGARAPAALTDGLAYLLGAWDGDGRVRPNGVGFTGNIKEEILRAHIDNTFHSEFQVGQHQYNFPSRPGSFDMEHYSTEFKDWWHAVAGERGKVVPSGVRLGTQSQVCAYLRGLFDTDGWINNQYVLGIKLKNRDFQLEIQQMLLSLGILSDLREVRQKLEKTGKFYSAWSLLITDRNSLIRFEENIGFTEPWKLTRLRQSRMRPRIRDTRMYPLGQTFTRVCEKHLPYKVITQGWLPRGHHNNLLKARKTGWVSAGAIKTVLDYLDMAKITDADIEHLRYISSFVVYTLKSVVETGTEGHVYDLEVGGDHEYLTGPILSHNCERSSDVVTASWKDEELTKNNMALMQCLKSRDSAGFEPFYVGVEWPIRRLFSLDDAVMMESSARMGAEIDLSDDLSNL